MMKPHELANTIHHCRKVTGLSQHALAQLAGVGKTVIYDIEKGKMTVQLDTLLKVLDALNINLHLESPIPMNSETKE